MRLILVHPQIPQNAGNVVRLCAATGASLTLVRPLGFAVTDRRLKRAGLDYWLGVDVEIVDQLEPLLEESTTPFYFFSSRATRCYSQVQYAADSWLIFGSETDGLPREWLTKWPERLVTIPMRQGCRCLNLANSCAIALYEAERQQQFASLSC